MFYINFQLEQAHEAYVQQNKGATFNLLHVYNLLTDEDKCNTIKKKHIGFLFAPRQ